MSRDCLTRIYSGSKERYTATVHELHGMKRKPYAVEFFFDGYWCKSLVSKNKRAAIRKAERWVGDVR